MLAPLVEIGKSIDYNNCGSEYISDVYQAYIELAQENKLGPYVTLFGFPVHFDPTYRQISVNFSGGADSTILLYVLCIIVEKLNARTVIRPVAVTRYYKTNYFNEAAKNNCLNYIKERFPDILGEPIWGFLPPAFEYTPLDNIVFADDNEQQQYQHFIDSGAHADVLFFNQFNEWTVKKYGLNAIYSGSTINPSENIPSAPVFRNKDQKSQNIKEYVADKYSGHKFIIPFSHLEKNYTTALYDLLSVGDLFDLTQSCEVQEGGCMDLNNCFHCAERQWSIDNKRSYIEDVQ